MAGRFGNFATNTFGDYDYTSGGDTPNPFSFDDITGAELSFEYQSNIETITGMSAGTSISIIGGEYSLDGGAYTDISGTINPDQTVQLRLLSSSSELTTVSSSLTIGTVTEDWFVTTGTISETIYSTDNRLFVFDDTIPFSSEKMNSDDHDWFYGCWQEKIVETQSIVSSVWEVPSGFTVESSVISKDVIVDSITYNKCNGALISTTLSEGQYMIYNIVTTSGGRELKRGFKIELGG